MKRRHWWRTTLGALVFPLPGFAEKEAPRVRIILDPKNPEKSFGEFVSELPGRLVFPVGMGRNGVTAKGESFVANSSLLGTFSVNAILTKDRFLMTDELVEQSGKSREWLAANLFKNMSSIDFDGDGRGGEYGDAFIGLEPIEGAVDQPFHFAEFKGIFRWYSYAIHGTQNEERIGRRVTGGCLNLASEDLSRLIAGIRIGDRVEVIEASR